MSGRQTFTRRHSIQTTVAVVMMMLMSACAAARPNARLLDQAPGNAPAIYKQGWREGCESGMAITGNQLYKTVYQNRINPQLVNNVQYYRGWNEAKVYCAHYTMATQWEGGVLPLTPSEERTLLPQEPQGIFTVVASWGPPTMIGFGNDPEPESDSNNGFGILSF
ncbi:MAG: hypothetical protein K0R63_536 [Rickettsiales bacterium]|nr:hypothetical protein [Rickettsiales bacterium]